MNAVRLFQNKVKGIKSISSDGIITFDMGELTQQDVEELSHLRISNVNGVLFDDRDKQIKEDF